MRSARYLLPLALLFFVVGNCLIQFVSIHNVSRDISTSSQFLIDRDDVKINIRLRGSWNKIVISEDEDTGLLGALISDQNLLIFMQQDAGDWDFEKAINVHMDEIKKSEDMWISPEYVKVKRGEFEGGVFVYAENVTSENDGSKGTLLHAVQTLVIEGVIYRIQGTKVVPFEKDAGRSFENHMSEMLKIFEGISFEVFETSESILI